MRRTLLSATSLIFVASTAFAQAAPAPAAAAAKANFAGKWEIVADTSATAQQAGMPRGGAQMGGLGEGATIAQDERALSITRAGPDGSPFTSTWALDGSETHQTLNMNGNGLDLTLKGKWTDKQFVASTWVNFGGQGFEITLALSLDDKGNLVTEHTYPALGNGMQGGTITTKYKKAQ